MTSYQEQVAHFARANNQYLSHADNASLSPGSADFTWVGWFWFDTIPSSGTSSYYGLICKNSDYGAQNEFSLLLNGDTTYKWEWQVSSSGAGPTAVLDADASIGAPVAGRWYFVRVWHDTTNNQIGLEVDGASVTSSYSSGVYDGASQLEIGRHAAGHADNGRIGPIGFWKSLLTPSQRDALYNGGIPLAYGQVPSDIKALDAAHSYWELDELSGARYDSGPGGNHLSDNNGVSVPPGQTTTYAYDDANRRTSMTDPNNKATSYGYDNKNRLTSVTDAATGVTTYAYDAADNRTGMTDAKGHNRSWTYDNVNRLLTATDADSKVTAFTYDGAGNVATRVDANNATTTYYYDTINRLTAVSPPSGGVSYTYNAVNKVTLMGDGTGNTSYAYDELDRYASVAYAYGTKIISYTYDAAGNRTRVTYPDAKTVDYAFDNANRLSTVTDWLAKVTAYGYDDAGRLTSTTFPSATGIVETRSYNHADQLLRIKATKGSSVLTQFSYTLDNAGYRTKVTIPTGTQLPAGDESYSYDNLYRLTQVTYPGPTTDTYTYDAVGNRLTKNGAGYTYSTGDRMTAAGGVAYTYDNNGNQTARGSDSFSWDAYNRLTQATVGGTLAMYQYRGDNLRHNKWVGGVNTTYTWDVNTTNYSEVKGMLSKLLKSGGTGNLPSGFVARNETSGYPVILQDGTYTYVYGHGLISQTDASSVQTYFLGNALGSTEALTDGSGTVTGTRKYDAFGAVRSSSGSATTEYEFTGQQTDATLGYTYLRARYYDSAIGRFISQDTHPAAAAKPDTLDRYAYAQNNPTNLTDPRGTYAGSWEDILEALFQPPGPDDPGDESEDSGEAGDSGEHSPDLGNMLGGGLLIAAGGTLVGGAIAVGAVLLPHELATIPVTGPVGVIVLGHTAAAVGANIVVGVIAIEAGVQVIVREATGDKDFTIIGPSPNN